jgi:putative NADPH-quinone reductase
MKGVKNVLIINGNPDPSPDRLSAGLAEAYQQGAEQEHHLVRRVDIGAVDFPLLRTAAQFTSAPEDTVIREAQKAFLGADHILFIYPLWLGGPPAILKGFMEQLGRQQFLLRENKRGFPLGALKGRSASVIVTMGMPPFFYRTMFGAHGVKGFNLSLLRLAGIRPIATHLFGGRAITPPHSLSLIEKTRKLGRKLG